MIVLPREGWELRPLPRLGHLVDPLERTHVVIHHTATRDDDDTPAVWEELIEVKVHMRYLQTVRAADLGADVPYSFVAFQMADGGLILAEGRGLYRSGAHTVGHNTAALGIAFAGNFETAAAPAASQLRELGRWLAGLHRIGFGRLGSVTPPRPDAGLPRVVWAHRDFRPTACPGRNLMAALVEIRP